jgi:hypothetical protein
MDANLILIDGDAELLRARALVDQLEGTRTTSRRRSVGGTSATRRAVSNAERIELHKPSRITGISKAVTTHEGGRDLI